MKRHSIDCQHCGAEITNGRALCATCQAGLLVYLEFVPVYFRNLTRWRPSSSGTSRPVPSSREPNLPGTTAPDRIGHLLEQTHAQFATWLHRLAADRTALAPAIEIIERRPLDDEAVVRVGCRLLTLHADQLATLPWVGDLVRALATHEALLREETERVVPGWYAGACGHCGVGTYVVPGLTWVTCAACGTTTNVSDHLDVILKEASGWTARPRQLATVVVALTTETSIDRVYERIRKAALRERLTPIRETALVPTYDETTDTWAQQEREVGHASYRLGEVLDRLTRPRSPTRATAAS